MSRQIKVLDVSHAMLVGPRRLRKEGNGERIRPGLVYRAQTQRFLDHDGKERSRLVYIEGPVEVVSSTRESGELITDYAHDLRVSAEHLDDDAWYAEVFEDPILRQIYDKGHLIAAQFGGPTHPLNMAPQLAWANRRSKRDGRWNDIEREVRSKLLKGARTIQGKNDEVLVQAAQGDMRVTLAYDDSSPIRTIIPFSYCLRVRVKGEELSQHAWNGVLTDLGAAENMRRKSARREAREEEKKKKGRNDADQGRP